MDKNAVAAAPPACRLFWTFMVCGLLGVGVEYLIILFSHGVPESRAGVLYGPFNQIYGLGAVLLVWLLRRCQRTAAIFAGGFVISGLFEFVGSWLQEVIFGSVSWDYSQAPDNICGRTSLTFMALWGGLAVLLLKLIYPGIGWLLDRTSRRILKPMTWITAVVIVLDLALSAAAVLRAAERFRGVPAVTFVQKTLDQLYPDDAIRKVYPNLRQLR